MSNSTFGVYLRPNALCLVIDWKELTNPCAALSSLPTLGRALAITTLIPVKILSDSFPA